MTFGGASPSAVPTAGSSSWGSSASAALDSRVIGRSSVTRALVGGVEVAVVGAVAWGVVAYLTKHQYSLIALAVGIGIGYMVSRYRRGDPVVSAAAAVLALLGCALGTFVALVFVALRTDGMGHLNAIVRAYPGSVGTLGIVLWLMAAVAAFTYPMGVHASTSAQRPQDRQEPQFSPRPPRAGRAAPGGFGTPQAPSSPRDDDAGFGAPEHDLAAAQPAAGTAMYLWKARPATAPSEPEWVVQPVMGQVPPLHPAVQPVMGQVRPLHPPAQSVSGQAPPLDPAVQAVTEQMPAVRSGTQPVSGQVPPMGQAVQPVAGQMPALRPSAQPQGWELQPTPRARHRAPQSATAEPTTGQWAADQMPGRSGGEQSSALPRRQRSVGRHSRPTQGPS